jgi:signal transduction histidine kinase
MTTCSESMSRRDRDVKSHDVGTLDAPSSGMANSPVRDRFLTRPAALALFLFTAVSYLGAWAFQYRSQPFVVLVPGDVGFSTLVCCLAVAGLSLVVFSRHELTGWILLAETSVLSAAGLLQAVAVRIVLVHDSDTVVGALATWLALWLIPLAIGAFPFAVAAWPGNFAPTWFRRLTAVALVALTVVVLAQALVPGSLTGLAPGYRIDNPLGVNAARSVLGVVTGLGVLTLLGYLVVAVMRAVQFSFRSRPRSVAWLVVALVTTAVLVRTAVAVGPKSGLWWLLAVLLGAMAAIVVAVSVAVRAEQGRRAAETAQTSLVVDREEQRRRLRTELHDGIGPLLAAIGLELDRLGDDDELSRAKGLVQDAITEVRRISADLRPAALDELGLEGAIRRHATSITDAGGPRVRITTEPNPLPLLPASVEVAAYRIAGEAITNAVRHAHATELTVQMVSGDDLRVEIRDNGVGPAGGTDGTGVRSMRARARELGGWLSVTGDSGPGTTVIAVLPL